MRDLKEILKRSKKNEQNKNRIRCEIELCKTSNSLTNNLNHSIKYNTTYIRIGLVLKHSFATIIKPFDDSCILFNNRSANR